MITEHGMPSAPGSIRTGVYPGISSEIRSARVRSSNDCRTFAVVSPSRFGPTWITPIRYFTYPETERFPGLSIGPRTR